MSLWKPTDPDASAQPTSMEIDVRSRATLLSLLLPSEVSLSLSFSWSSWFGWSVSEFLRLDLFLLSRKWMHMELKEPTFIMEHLLHMLSQLLLLITQRMLITMMMKKKDGRCREMSTMRLEWKRLCLLPTIKPWDQSMERKKICMIDWEDINIREAQGEEVSRRINNFLIHFLC